MRAVVQRIDADPTAIEEASGAHADPEPAGLVQGALVAAAPAVGRVEQQADAFPRVALRGTGTAAVSADIDLADLVPAVVPARSTVAVVVEQVDALPVAERLAGGAGTGPRDAVLSLAAGTAASPAMGRVAREIDAAGGAGGLPGSTTAFPVVAVLPALARVTAGPAMAWIAIERNATLRAGRGSAWTGARASPADPAVSTGNVATPAVVGIAEGQDAAFGAGERTDRASAVAEHTDLSGTTGVATAPAVLRIGGEIHAGGSAFGQLLRALRGAASPCAHLLVRALGSASAAMQRARGEIDAVLTACRAAAADAVAVRTRLADPARGAAGSAILGIRVGVHARVPAGEFAARAAADPIFAPLPVAAGPVAFTAMLGVRGKIDAAPVAGSRRRRAFIAARPRSADLVGRALVAATTAMGWVSLRVDAGLVAEKVAGGADARTGDASRTPSASESAIAAVQGVARQVDAAPVAFVEASRAPADAQDTRHAAGAGPIAAAAMEWIGGGIDAARAAVHIGGGTGSDAGPILAERRRAGAAAAAHAAVVRVARERPA